VSDSFYDALLLFKPYGLVYFTTASHVWLWIDLFYINILLCVLAVQDLDENTERDSDEEEVYQETDWVDVTDGYNLKPQKKVNMTRLDDC